jgi:7,8-dihydro-6-hydroxymethylpterin-pyrophosphokinase
MRGLGSNLGSTAQPLEQAAAAAEQCSRSRDHENRGEYRQYAREAVGGTTGP